MSSDQMPAPGKTKLIKFPPSLVGKDVKCPGGMLKLRFDWYISYDNYLQRIESTINNLTFKEGDTFNYGRRECSS